MTGRRTVALLVLVVSLCAFVVLPSIAAGEQATYVVDSNADSGDVNPGDGLCEAAGGHCTLRAAIDEANTHSGSQTIEFAYRFTGTSYIPGCNLPTITADDLTIDASDQWWFSQGRPGVEIRGSGCTLLTIHADRVVVAGLMFGGGGTVGVSIDACNGGNLVGGFGSTDRNVFTTITYGVRIGMNAGTNNGVIGNYFGTIDGYTLPGGTAYGGTGILVESDHSGIYNNLIAGQVSRGIEVSNADSVLIIQNIIGLDASMSTSLPNGTGVYVAGSNSGVLIGPINTIAGNTSHGIELYHADNTMVSGNDIGRPYGLGNGGDGVHVQLSHGVQIGDADYGNTISDNSGNGVWVDYYDVTLQGNTIIDNDLDGVELGWSGSQIGGSAEGERNRISGNGANGIHLNGTSGITVTGNWIGLGNSGANDHGNGGHGVLINGGGVGNYIGGTDLGEGNWIAYNHGDGVRINGGDTQGNYVVGNVIGAPINWAWKAANHNHGVGIYGGAHDNWIGVVGTVTAGNTIATSAWSGVAVVNSDDNAVLANYIGTNGAAVNWGNAYYGVDVVGSSGTSIEMNEIAYNGTHNGIDGAEAGVHVQGAAATDNLISGNSIHDSDGPGIELESGGNNSLAAPVITSAGCGSVQGTACANCLIEFYSDNANEGQVYEGHFTTPPSGAITWSGVVNGPWVTALAIGPGSSNDTSPFSIPFPVGACNAWPEASFTVAPTTGFTSTIFSFDASGCSDVEDPTSALRVRWDWDGNGVYDTGWTTTKTATQSYSLPYTYTVRLEVMDTMGLKDATTRQVRVSERNSVYLPLVLRNAN
jgi:CSLREA domain-containing protein